MKRRMLLIGIICILSLCGCGQETADMPENKESPAQSAEPNVTNESDESPHSMEISSEDYNWYSYETELYTIPEAELGLDDFAVWMRYEEAIEKGEMVEYPGTLPGAAEGVWCCVTVDGVEYIYGRYDEQERYELYAYAIVGEACILGNGLQVGLTREEVLKLCQGIADAKLKEEDGYDLIWSSGCYPIEWEEKYDYAMILDVDDGVENNKMTYLALMMKENKVCAMTPYVPITDGMVLPENPKDALDLRYEEQGWKVSVEDLAYEGLYVYEKYVESEGRYEVLLTNGEQEYIHDALVADYDVCWLKEGYALFTVAEQKGSEESVFEPYILNVETMQMVGSVESPVAFMEVNWNQEPSGRWNVVKLLEEYTYIGVWKDEKTEKIYSDVTWGQDITFEVVHGQILCRIGLYQEQIGCRGYVELPYVAEGTDYVIDRENIAFDIDAELNDLASETFEEKYMKQLKGVDLDGDGVATDTLTLQRVREGDKAHNLLTIVLDYGLTASLQLPSHEVYANDHADIIILQDLQMPERTSIGVFLQSPQSNYGSTDYYILHVEKDAEKGTLEVKVDLSIYDGWGSSLVEAAYPETVLKMPFESVSFYDESGVIYNETLQKNTLRVQGLSDGKQEETCCYVYWDENAWQVLEENSQNNPSKG